MSPNDIQAPSLVRRPAIQMEMEDAKNKQLAEEREKERVKKEEEEWRKKDIEDNERKQHEEAEKKKKEEEEPFQREEEERKRKVEEEERKKDEEEEEQTRKEEEKERICKEAEAGLQRSISRCAAREQIAAEREAAQKVNNMSRGGSRRGQDQQQTDEWTTTHPAKAGDLTNFGKISKPSTMTFGPSGVFAGKTKESKQDSTVSQSASGNMFSMLQNAEAVEAATKPSRPPSQKPSVDLLQSGMASEQLQCRKMQLLWCLGLMMRHSTKPPRETGTHLLAPPRVDAQLGDITRWGEEHALTLLSPACTDSLPLTFTPHSTPAFPFTPNPFICLLPQLCLPPLCPPPNTK
ncbi:hypothetical protein NEOLEDRAFT_1180927 [Neolentinus lepideus HHB14362 ss-1]|uniref:Uncharacterized protein n=1 Tax=Neolentinus lepideus HHB14362 ss-1 TaxID=1314782 RepID=A0A165QEV1_9AGAM|nr:hypothetical protein NEOLEDRAFT_1180927 [Neolentinus lepideus HHB14362 ss-1]